MILKNVFVLFVKMLFIVKGKVVKVFWYLKSEIYYLEFKLIFFNYYINMNY